MPPIEKPSISALLKPSHLLERGRDLAGAAGNACVVEQDHLTVASQAIRHRRVPVIHGARVVLVEDKRYAGCCTEAAVGEAVAVDLDEPRWSGLVGVYPGVRRHDLLLRDLERETKSGGCFAAIDVQDMAGDE
jgi:hypothetical protein